MNNPEKLYDLRNPEIIADLVERAGNDKVHEWLKRRMPANYDTPLGSAVLATFEEIDTFLFEAGVSCRSSVMVWLRLRENGNRGDEYRTVKCQLRLPHGAHRGTCDGITVEWVG